MSSHETTPQPLRERILDSARRWTTERDKAVAALMPPAPGFDETFREALPDLLEILGPEVLAFLSSLHGKACFTERTYPLPRSTTTITVLTGLMFLPITGFTGAITQTLADQRALDALTRAFEDALPLYGFGKAKAVLLPGSVGLMRMILAGPEALHAAVSAAVSAADSVRDPRAVESLTRLPGKGTQARMLHPFGNATLSGDPAGVQSRCLVFALVQERESQIEAAEPTPDAVDPNWLDRAQAHVPLLFLGRPSDPHGAIRTMAINLVRNALRLEAASLRIAGTSKPDRYHVYRHDNGIDITAEYGRQIVGPAGLPAICADLVKDALITALSSEGIPITQHADSFHAVHTAGGRLS